MKSNEIVTLFLARADAHGVARLSIKQTTWLLDVICREQRIPRGQSRHQNIIAQDNDGKYYEFAVYPNGAGFIKPCRENPQPVDQSNQYLLDVIAKFRAEGNTVAADALEASIK